MKASRQAACLEEAMAWCCRRRKDAPPDADIWHLWFHWQGIRGDLLAALTQNRYRLSAMQIVGRGRQRVAIWSAQDAVVLKWVAMQLHDSLPVHPLCEHHKGHGGGRHSVHKMARSLKQQGWSYVCRTDIQGFYGHIRRGPLMRQLKRHVSDPVLLNLVRQYLHYSVERGGEFYTPRRGICRGCALSPLLAGFCLWAMDTYFEAQQPALRYVRYMDDIVIFTRTRWHLRRAVRTLNAFFASGGYRQHPDKTFIGKTGKGFDWMGIQFNGSGITGVAPRALTSHRERCRRLYEQAWCYGKKKTRARVAEYVKRWTIWRTHTMHQTQCSGTVMHGRGAKQPGGWKSIHGTLLLIQLLTGNIISCYAAYPAIEQSSIIPDGSTSGTLPGIAGRGPTFETDGLLPGADLNVAALRTDDGTAVPRQAISDSLCLTRDHGSKTDSACADGIHVSTGLAALLPFRNSCLDPKDQSTCNTTISPSVLFNMQPGAPLIHSNTWPTGFWSAAGVSCPTCSAGGAAGSTGAGTASWSLGAGTDLSKGGTFRGSLWYSALGDTWERRLTIKILQPAPTCDISAPPMVDFGPQTSGPSSGKFSYIAQIPIELKTTCSNIGTANVGQTVLIVWSGLAGTDYSFNTWVPDTTTNPNYPFLQIIRPDGTLVSPGVGDTAVSNLALGSNTGINNYTLALGQSTYAINGVGTSPGTYHWSLGYQVYIN